MNARRIVATLGALVLLVSCSEPHPPEETPTEQLGIDQVLQRLDELEDPQVGRISVEGDSSVLVHREGGSWTEEDMYRSLDTRSEQLPNAPYEPVPVEQLRLTTFLDLLDGLPCEKESQAGTITSTNTGAIIHLVACLDAEAADEAGEFVIHGTWIDGVEVQPGTEWDEEGIDAAIATLVRAQGPEAIALNFVLDPRISQLSGRAVTTSTVLGSGSDCLLTTILSGTEAGELVYGDCSRNNLDPEDNRPFDLNQAVGARVLEGLHRGLDELGVELEDLLFFAVRNDAQGLVIHLSIDPEVADDDPWYWSGRLR